jgi:hypothetical protein
MNFRRVVIVISVLALTIVIYFIGRNWLLQRIFEREKRQLLKVYGLQINAAHIGFTGLNSVRIDDLPLVPEGADTLVKAAGVEFHLSLSNLITGSIGISNLHLNDVLITAYHEHDRDNLAFLTKRQKEESAVSEKTVSYKELAESRQKKLLRLLNIAVVAERVSLVYDDSAGISNIYLPELQFDKQKLSATVINLTQNDTLAVNGMVLQKNSEYQFNVNHTGIDTAWLPFLNRSPGLKCAFRSISGALKFASSGEAWLMHVHLHANGLYVNYWRLSKGNVLVPETQLNSLFRITDDAFELDSTSALSLGGARFKLSAQFQRSTDTLIAFSVHMPEIPCDTFFSALPDGMFNTLKGISCSGSLTYDLRFSMHTSVPDSLIFESSLKRKDFHIIHYGSENLARINGPFIYDAYQGNQVVRKIEIGSDNPDYTPLDRISHYLPLCIMQSEDPGFMEHRGFIPEAMRESIAQDYREKRFARGGSTISMQLVKNVFLRRDKTISRKLEEALIVYLIENLQLVSKERMMEVYLNVIEWGPGIYGVAEASDFYFHKSPAQLTLPECVFLAAIIPNPRSFRYQFDKTGHVKAYITDFYKLINRPPC